MIGSQIGSQTSTGTARNGKSPMYSASTYSSTGFLHCTSTYSIQYSITMVLHRTTRYDDDLRMMMPAPTMVGAATHFGALGRLSATQAMAPEAPAALSCLTLVLDRSRCGVANGGAFPPRIDTFPTYLTVALREAWPAGYAAAACAVRLPSHFRPRRSRSATPVFSPCPIHPTTKTTGRQGSYSHRLPVVGA